jgi:hypothetical protein
MVQSQLQENSSPDPILKKPITNKGWWSGSRCSPEFKPQCHHQKKKKNKKKKPNQDVATPLGLA